MDEATPSAAVYAGSFAGAYEYRTAGVPATPYIRWSFALLNEAYLCCPILAQQERIYLADSAGYFSALNTRSGKLLWSFATDWVQNPCKSCEDYSDGVISFCLSNARGYILTACETLYELDWTQDTCCALGIAMC